MQTANLKWNSFKATILLPIQKPFFNEKISSYATENGYVIKPEFHASIIGLQNGKKIIEKYENDEKFLEQIKSLAESFSWSVEYLEEYFVIEKYYDQIELVKSGYENVPPQVRRTIIQKILFPDLGIFYQKLEVLTGITFAIPFSHVTLFAWCDYAPLMTQGIGLYSESDFEKYKKQEIVV